MGLFDQFLSPEKQQVILESTGIGKLVEYLYLFVQNDARIRRIQAENTPRNVLSVQATVLTATTFQIDAAQSDAQRFSSMTIIVETTAGEARVTIDGSFATTTLGGQVPAGGGIINVDGAENIKQFRLTPTTATSVPLYAMLFK